MRVVDAGTRQDCARPPLQARPPPGPGVLANAIAAPAIGAEFRQGRDARRGLHLGVLVAGRRQDVVGLDGAGDGVLGRQGAGAVVGFPLCTCGG